MGHVGRYIEFNQKENVIIYQSCKDQHKHDIILAGVW